MIDKELLRTNPDFLRAACAAKGVAVDFETLLDLELAYRKLQHQEQELQTKMNQASQQFPSLPESEKEILKKEILLWKNQLAEVKDRVENAVVSLNNMLWDIPNPPAPDVKIGAGYDENEVIREVAPPPQSSPLSRGRAGGGSASPLASRPSHLLLDHIALPPRHSRAGGNLLLDHTTLGQNLGVDMERGAKVSGSRFAFLRGPSADLAWALAQYGVATAKKYGFEFVLPPVLVKGETMQAMGYLQHGGEEETYHFEKDDLYLTATSEQSLVGMYQNEIIPSNDLPLRFVGYSSCFRREAGSYGKDVRGLIRTHQFEKVEMVSLVLPELADEEHDRILAIAEEFVAGLGLPYRVVKSCSGDLGDPAARKYDIECFLPSENQYRETHSCSLCTDFQARRLGLKYKEGTDKPKYLYTLNGTVVAVGRMLAILMENYQQADGTVEIPEVLKKYLV